MLTIVLGFATSLVYGFADFFGALSSRKLKAVLVTAISGFTGLVFLFAMTPFFGADFGGTAIWVGVAAGLFSAFAMSCLYASLAIGPISILSPLGAVISAIVPMVWAIAGGESFGLLKAGATGLILVAVVLVAFVPGAEVKVPSAKGLLLGVGAGVGIGAVLISLKLAPLHSGLATVIVMRAVSASLLGLFLLASVLRGRKVGSLRQGAATLLFVGIAGIFDSSANVFFLLASRTGSLTVVSVLTALYPLGTIILARVFLKERIANVQLAGVLLALVASAILAVA
jgi:EamA domain-containing membrane protein RarD